MKIAVIAIVILLLIALVFGSMYVGRRNQMVVKREAVSASWAQVDVVLQRRADLIPNLVETVKGFAQHDEQVFGDIAAARAAALPRALYVTLVSIAARAAPPARVARSTPPAATAPPSPRRVRAEVARANKQTPGEHRGTVPHEDECDGGGSPG